MRNILFVVFALVLMAGISQAQIMSTSGALYAVDVVNGLNISPTDGSLSSLSAGYTYTYDADPNNPYPVIPTVTGNESGSPLQFAIANSGMPQLIEVTYDLPKVLVGSVNQMNCSFASNSVYREEDGARFNPNAPFQLQLGSGGAATLDLGITVQVPFDALDGDAYQGLVTIICGPVGL